jgi:colanic acid/amylovoran biosynthesis glycosyltransferase
MKVYYLTMAFPVASETFKSNDVRSLSLMGLNVSVYTFRPKRSDFARLMTQRHLSSIEVHHNSMLSSVIGILYGAFRPKISLDLLLFILTHTWNHPSQLLKSLILMPRSLDIFFSIRRDRPDVVHLAWGHYPSLVGYLVKKWSNTIALSIFLGAHDLESRYQCTSPVLKRADAVFTHAKTNLDSIYNLGAKSVNVVYRGIDLNHIEQYRTIKKSPRSILAAGRLIPKKGFADVIRAFEQVIQDFPDASLQILGTGPEMQRLKQMAFRKDLVSSIYFRGHVSHSTVLEEMAKSEIFILMSQYHAERLPNVIKEAMASRCICITTPTPGIEELLVNEKSGYIVAPSDFKSAANIIERVFENPSAFNALVNSGYEHVIRHFNLHTSMAAYKSTWEKVINKALTDL